uniref:Cyclin A1 n=1 Tax=Solanum tuberosum TaxID=4113 RepID=M1BRA5_SOLTU
MLFCQAAKLVSIQRSEAILPKITAIHVPATCSMVISPSHSDESLVSMDESMSTSDTVRTPEVEYIDDMNWLQLIPSRRRRVAPSTSQNMSKQQLYAREIYLWTWNQGIKLSTLINYALQWACEEGEQGQLPVLVLSMKETDKKKRPAFVFLHSTNKCKEWLRTAITIGICFEGIHSCSN